MKHQLEGLICVFVFIVILTWCSWLSSSVAYANDRLRNIERYVVFMVDSFEYCGDEAIKRKYEQYIEIPGGFTRTRIDE